MCTKEDHSRCGSDGPTKQYENRESPRGVVMNKMDTTNRFRNSRVSVGPRIVYIENKNKPPNDKTSVIALLCNRPLMKFYVGFWKTFENAAIYCGNNKQGFFFHNGNTGRYNRVCCLKIVSVNSNLMTKDFLYIKITFLAQFPSVGIRQKPRDSRAGIIRTDIELR